jgi:hypothetical protein
MLLGNFLTVLMDANLYDASGCSKGSLGLIIPLKSTRQDLSLRVIPKKKENIPLTFIHLLLNYYSLSVTFFGNLLCSTCSSNKR